MAAAAHFRQGQARWAAGIGHQHEAASFSRMAPTTVRLDGRGRVDRRLFQAQRDVAAARIAQRVGVGIGKGLDVADEDDVVAGIDHLVAGAVEPGRRAVDERVAEGAGTPGGVLELVRPLGGEENGGVLLVFGEDVHREAAGGFRKPPGWPRPCRCR